MSLLVTSCTMGKQPDRLLHKGAAYLKTRTNISLFSQDRKSAVELLAASKSQFYVKSHVELHQHQDLAVSDGQNQRFISRFSKQKEPTRSKSEFDLSQILLSKIEDENDENNNDTSNDSIDSPQQDDAQQALVKNSVKNIARNKESEAFLLPYANSKVSHNSPGPNSDNHSSNAVEQTPNTSAQSEIRFLSSPLGNAQHSNASLTKPVPLPRTQREKPVPPPRRNRVSSLISAKEPESFGKQASPNFEKTVSLTDSPIISSKASCRPETKPAIPKKPLLTSSTPKSGSTSSDVLVNKETSQINLKPSSSEADNKCTFTATPIFISSPKVESQNFQAKPIFISEFGITLVKNSPSQAILSQSEFLDSESRTQCPEVLTKSGVRKKNSITSDSSSNKIRVQDKAKSESQSLHASKLEMSIESADQAVYESDISVLPLASMEADLDQSEAREVTRANSSLSGILDQHDSSPLSLSPTPYCSSVPRSHSDISCRLESQHSRDSSIVSSHSRLSRASAGADLENFFNQMGLEKGVLEPIGRLRELQTSELFDSMSSLDSHDATSICSTYSRSEQEWSESQSMDRSHHQTSIIERNARIIKWLCNVRKAKNHASKGETASGGKD